MTQEPGGGAVYSLFANMPVWLLKSLNVFFFGFHTIFTLFNLFGWILRRTRRLHLITMSLTAFSWFVLGIFYGFGYCFCTQWHWEVRELLGYHDTSTSYIHLLLTEVVGKSLNESMVIEATKWAFIFIIVGMIGTRLFDHLRSVNRRG